MVSLLFISIQIPCAEQGFDKSEYAARRAKFMEKIPDGVAVILGATTPASDIQFFKAMIFTISAVWKFPMLS